MRPEKPPQNADPSGYGLLITGAERTACAKASAVKSEAPDGAGCLSAVASAEAEGPGAQTNKC
jgi:hypothetical protein